MHAEDRCTLRPASPPAAALTSLDFAGEMTQERKAMGFGTVEVVGYLPLPQSTWRGVSVHFRKAMSSVPPRVTRSLTSLPPPRHL